MNELKNNCFLYLIIIIFPFASVSCQTKNEKEFVQFVVQPEAEIGKSIDFTIHFEEKPDSIWSSNTEINGLELTDKLDRTLSKIKESELTGDNDKVIKTFYSFYTYAKPTKLGKIESPILSVRYKGKVYKTTPFSINVVEKIKIDQDAVQVIWSTEKKTYHKTDTIKISLYEYSKFSQTKRIHSSPKNLSLTGKENKINVSVEETIDNIAGIDDFEKLIEQKFEIVNVDWNMFNSRQSMGKVENELFIKTLILELSLLSKSKGTFQIGPSNYDFFIHKSNTDYFNKFVPNDKGSYNVTEDGSTTLKIKSNTLTIKIE
ncbi:hypothetical protein EV200_106247 [Pedobacter psychrotolerans]|uniref:Uncharacterized protein n=1 Tax=Pedobacter psychrotolerans TaxID=1843235 RepID=A0A4R2H844_9SPHI|nr:hypothetical protein [Pedobacter psychrotolerans]TCO22604.1 hypothetical protein EV200_106247 [Pedobacter psychrotolerans]GGE65787.1 hypothetical protein GCM10011413_35380 [Pedobacter psychrotolerans]